MSDTDRTTGSAERRTASAHLDRSEYELEFDEQFDAPELNLNRWVPHYLPHWSSREASRARYEIGGGMLKLRIDDDQQPWSPEFNGALRVSNLQTGSYSGPLGSKDGQHRFSERLIVREEQPESRLYLPRFGLVEIRARALRHPRCMVALWLIGYEEEPQHSGEICIMEIFGDQVGDAAGSVGMGIHPFGDPTLVEDFEEVSIAGDLTEFHTYAAAWDPQSVSFYVDDILVKSMDQAPQYPMQLMLNVYEFPESPHGGSNSPAADVEKVFVVDQVRGWHHAGATSSPA